MSKANEAAFPVAASYSDDNPQVLVPVGGMSKRELIAKDMMAALIKNFVPIESKYSVNDGYMHFPEMAEDAVKAADALIAELEKTEK
jgi:hypothetical protein